MDVKRDLNDILLRDYQPVVTEERSDLGRESIGIVRHGRAYARQSVR